LKHPNLEIIGEGTVIIGERVSIQPGAQVIFQSPARVTIGDYCTIGSGVKFVCDGGDVALGDWTTLHDRCLLLSTVGVRIGQHCWFGQHAVLDGTGGLTIGNGVRVGMYSQIWSHVAAGEQIEGCTLYGTRPVNLEDDVWLVGSCIVASGVTLGKRTVALIASNITKSWPAFSVLAGSPATLKQSLSFYREISVDEKWGMLNQWTSELVTRLPVTTINAPIGIILGWSDRRNDDCIAFCKSDEDACNLLQVYPNATICTLSTKRYLKRLTELEHRVLKYLAGNKARFLSVTDCP
jgi:acetyltransferase-like isoleucine patch superfamily enzyme